MIIYFAEQYCILTIRSIFCREFLESKDAETEWNRTYEEPVNQNFSSSLEYSQEVR